MTDYLFILGADDPEMQAIESLLKECEVPYAYAVGPDGQRVHPGNAYKASHYTIVVPGSWTAVVFVECVSVADLDSAYEIITVDHHRPGDPGYGKPPAEFLSASSIGQVLALLPPAAGERITTIRVRSDRQQILADVALRVVPSATSLAGGCNDPEHCDQHTGHDAHGAPMVGLDITVSLRKAHRMIADRLHVAAADHCLAAAYRGECPGVDPDELMRWRIKSRAVHQGRPEAEVLDDVERARDKLVGAVSVIEDLRCDCCREPQGYCQQGNDPLGSPRVLYKRDYADLRGESIPELPEAACREGIAYLTTVTDRDGRKKEVLGGCTTPDMVQKWMDACKAEGREVYGDPVRGFAGAYLL